MIAALVFTTLFRPRETLRNIFPPPPEIVLYTAWVVWAGLTGLLIVVNQSMFLRALEISLQMVVMVWVIYAILQNQKSVDVIFLALVVGATVQIASVMMGVQNFNKFLSSSDRILGLTQNPNSLGFRMVWGTFGALFFWYLPGWKKILQWSAIPALAVAAGYLIISTGSRKSSLAFALLVVGWTLFCSNLKPSLSGYLKRSVMVLFALLALVSIIPFVMQETTLGHRFEGFFQGGRQLGTTGGEINLKKAAERNPRYGMYIEGFQLFSENPIFGIGLGNFSARSKYGKYSHSDMIESLACTGLIGFLLYQSFYVILVFRLIRLIRSTENLYSKYRLKLMLLGIVTVLFIGLGTPHYSSQPVFMILACISAYTWKLHRYKKLNMVA